MSSSYDVKPQPFKAWLRTRLKQGKRDAVDALAKKLIADTRIPARGSKALYVAQLRAKGYIADIPIFTQAWEEMREKSMIGNKEKQFEALYGPLARGEYSVGDTIAYRSPDTGGRVTGVVVWIAGPADVARRHQPLSYIVESNARHGFPDIVRQTDIIQ
jgi:hypothetical protein